VITIDTDETKMAEIDVDAYTIMFFEGKQIEPEDIVIGSQVKVIVKDNKAVLVRVTLADEEDYEE